jgi:hypothetical protein
MDTGKLQSCRTFLLSAALSLVLTLAASNICYAKDYQLQMSLSDIFHVKDTPGWKVSVEKFLPIRLADVKITPLQGYDFDMMLYFKCDTKDLALFDTPEKIASSIQVSSQKYLPHIVEKKILLQPVPIKSTYGYYTIMTDVEVAAKPVPDQGEYKYMTRGMVRLSSDSVLGFSIMSNDVNSVGYKKLLDYVFGFVKNK